jgi:hypothetical protein
MTSQSQSLSQLRDWAATKTAAGQDITPAAQQPASSERNLQDRKSQERQARRYEHVMGWDPSERLLAASDTIDEIRGWNCGQGHLIVTGPGLPVPALDAIALLGFAPADIEAAIGERIDKDGNLTTADIVAATAVLTGVPGTEDTFLRTIHDRATSPEALHDAEDSAYRDEHHRVHELSITDLITETGHPDLDSARQGLAARHGYASFADFDAALAGDWDETSRQLYAGLTATETALWEAAATNDIGGLSTAFPAFDQANSQADSYFAEQTCDDDSTAGGWFDDDVDDL